LRLNEKKMPHIAGQEGDAVLEVKRGVAGEVRLPKDASVR
jgi:hypothetical protein